MTNRQPDGRSITPRDVFARSNMPSRWERLTGVRPSTGHDRKYLAFAAARYRGDVRLQHPDALKPPPEFGSWESVRFRTRVVSALAVVLMVIGLASNLVAVAAAGVALLVGVVLWAGFMWKATNPAIQRFRDERSRSTASEGRLHSDPMDSENTQTVDQMILCDEGTLTYCAAKIAAEIERDPDWSDARTSVVSINLWDEVAEIAASAREINRDREAAIELERGRLRDDPEVKQVIDTYRQQYADAIAGLATRVHAFADFRDRIHRIGIAQRSETSALRSAFRSAADDVARKRVD